jgi:hypothetical protein
MKRVAAVVTTYFPASHADVIVSRWLHPRASDADWGWNGPKTRIASLYVAQTARRDPANPEFNGDDISWKWRPDTTSRCAKACATR